MSAPVPEAVRQVTAHLVKEIAQSIARTYKIDAQTAAQQIAGLVVEDPKLQQALRETQRIDEICRMRAYKDVEKNARKHIYNYLRRYKREDQRLIEALQALEEPAAEDAPRQTAAAAIRAICEAHVSTAERLSALDGFQRILKAHAKNATSILDVGAGVMPLIFPFADCPQLECYVALDKDQTAMRAVRAFARRQRLAGLEARDWTISDGWDAVLPSDRTAFDLAFLFKIVPVVARQAPRLLATLADTPAKALLITGSKEALARRKVIAHREQRAIMSFIEEFGFSIDDRLETEDEIGFLVSRRGDGQA